MVKPRAEILACLFAHEMLRRLGISADDICMVIHGPTATPPNQMGVLVCQNGKKWYWLIGHLPRNTTAHSMMVEWQAAVAEWNSMELTSDPLGFMSSPQLAMSASVIASLQVNGIEIAPMWPATPRSNGEEMN
jgi:hypothetical protein